jgi:hypothetical protein
VIKRGRDVAGNLPSFHTKFAIDGHHHKWAGLALHKHGSVRLLAYLLRRKHKRQIITIFFFFSFRTHVS